MVSSENKSWFATVLITGILTIAFVGLYYLAHSTGNKSLMGKEFDVSGRPTKPLVNPDQTVLTRNKKYVSGRNSIVFRGMKQKMIVIDLYLLDMDPQQPYEKLFRKKDAKKGMVLGEGRYRLVTVNDQHLVLKNAASK